MTRARSEQVALDATPFYHCMMRCVRRAYLCGNDKVTGQDFEHRRQWIVSRLKFLSYVYAIDICAYAVMHNHYHVVLHVDAKRAQGWSDKEVVERWMQLFKGHVMVDRWLACEDTTEAEQAVVSKIIAEWRERLSSISWFMRCMNQTIAAMANEEDGCKGRFWEGRFKSQALLDEAAVLTCMAYVDLNPVRAGIADTLEQSDFTSIQQRIFDFVKHRPKKTVAVKALVKNVTRQKVVEKELGLSELPKQPLMAFDGSIHTPIDEALPFTKADYFELVDMAGRTIRDGKRGFIDSQVPPILLRMGIEPIAWLEQVRHYGQYYGHCAGSVDKIRSFAKQFKHCWFKGIASAGQLYLLA